MKKTCRMCGGKKFKDVINLGNHPLFVNNLLTKENLKDDKTYPLLVEQCQSCFLVQIRNIVNPSDIYQKADYLFFSSDMPNLSDYFKMFAEDAKNFLAPNDLVVDIGSNDGILLKHFKDYRVLGIDPSTNVVLRALKNGIPTVSDFFTKQVARKIKGEWGQASLITGFNCIAHTDTLDDLMEGVKTLLTNDGVFVVECNYWGDMVRNKNYALIYHDHFSYFTLNDWVNYAKKFGMNVFDAEIPPAQGDIPDIEKEKAADAFNIRIFIDNEKRPQTERMKQILKGEESLHSYETARQYSKDVKEQAKKLGDLIKGIKSEGKTIAGYGAAAKGFTVLKLAEIDSRYIDYFIDDSPAKQNKYTPISHIPIYPRENQNPDYFLIAAPNYVNVIINKENEYLNNGGKFITIEGKIIDGDTNNTT